MADTQKATLRNTSDGPRGFHSAGGFVSLEKGESWTGEILKGELSSATDTGYFNGEGVSFSEADILSAVNLLDPKNDEHWTKGGEPSVEAVGEALGGAVSRTQIKAAAPDAKRAA